MVSKEHFEVYLKSAAYGGCLSGFSLFFEHPFDNIKTRLQNTYKQKIPVMTLIQQVQQQILLNYPINTLYFTTFSQTLSTRGFLGFYTGYSANLTRAVLKNCYRWPLMLSLTTIYHENCGFSKLNAKMLTGVSIALLETSVLCPLERLKVLLMTANQKLSLINVWKETNNKFSFFYTGFKPLIIRQSISWVSFLGGDYLCKSAYKSIFKAEVELNMFDVILVSMSVGLFNSLVILPVDTVKTLHQSHKNEDYKTQKVSELMKKMYNQGGVRSFYRGFHIKMMQYFVNLLFTETQLIRFEGIMQKLQKKQTMSIVICNRFYQKRKLQCKLLQIIQCNMREDKKQVKEFTNQLLIKLEVIIFTLLLQSIQPKNKPKKKSIPPSFNGDYGIEQTQKHSKDILICQIYLQRSPSQGRLYTFSISLCKLQHTLGKIFKPEPNITDKMLSKKRNLKENY